MAKKPLPSAPPAKRRGRPPKPGGPTPQAEIQRAYRARLAAAGKVVRLVDADPAGALDREAFDGIREKLNNALSKLGRREEDIARLEARNAYLEGELRLQGQHHTNALKEIVTLKQELARLGAGKPPENRQRTAPAVAGTNDAWRIFPSFPACFGEQRKVSCY